MDPISTLPVPPPLPIWVSYVAVAVGGIAGASHAARRGFDVIGVLGLAVATGLGGLLLRDILLQKGTPVVLTDPRYLLAAAIAALGGFFFAGSIARPHRPLIVLDALSLGLFVSLGASAALYFQLSWIAAIFLGVTTAVGGGLLRDLLSGQTPTLLQPGIISGLAALIGAMVFVLLSWANWPAFWIQVVTISTVFAVRIGAIWRRWEAPRPVDMPERISDALAHTQLPDIDPSHLLPRVGLTVQPWRVPHAPADRGADSARTSDDDDSPAPAAQPAHDPMNGP